MAEIIKVTTHNTRTGIKNVEYQNPKFVKKSKRQKKEERRQKKRKKLRADRNRLAQPSEKQKEQDGPPLKKRKLNTDEKPRKKRLLPTDEIWEIWCGGEFDQPGPCKKYKTQDNASVAAEKILERLKKKDELDGFEKHILKNGTLTDRLSAWTVMFQERPLARLPLLRKLVKWAQRKNRREKQLALQNLLILFNSDVMPSRTLRSFAQRGFKKPVSEKILCMWYFESQLKELYAQFISALEEGTKDHMDWFRRKCVEMVAGMLERNAEGEKVLLMLLIHKLGDKANKVASGTLRQIQKLLKEHPAMKGVVAREVSDFLKRSPHHRCKNYALTLLSEFEYHSTEEDQKAAKLCIDLFLEIFVESYGEKGKSELTGKMMTALFTGIRRAFPYAKPDLEVFATHLHTFYKLTHTGSFQTGVQALWVLRHIEEASGEVSDRFYRALYGLIIRPEITGFSKPHLLMHILYITIKNDKDLNRVAAFLKRLSQIASQHNSAFACGALLLVSECFKTHTGLQGLFSITPEEALDGNSDDEALNKEVSDALDYDAMKKEPKFSRATNSPFWESVLLRLQYHPSTQVWAKKLQDGEGISYKGDPLVDFTTSAFLKRYSYRRPKKNLKTSKFARDSREAATNVLDLYDKEKPQAVGTPSDLLFHRYFSQRSKLDPTFYERRKEKQEKRKRKETTATEEAEDAAMYKVLAQQFGIDKESAEMMAALGGNFGEDQWDLLEEAVNLGDEIESDEGEYGNEDENLFVDAEEFGELLAEQTSGD